MTTRDQITPAELSRVAAGAKVSIVASRTGYGVAIGPAERVRWLHDNSGSFRLFRTADHAIAFLAACGVRRITLDLTGGTPQ